jgi:ActR/RegA family two-component response regulator
VDNLSAGGALLSEGPVVPVGEGVEIELRFGTHVVARVVGEIVRHQELGARGVGLAVVFAIDDPDTQDALQQYALQQLERLATPGVLVVSRAPDRRERLARAIERLDLPALVAASPLEAIAHVVDPRTSVRAAVVDGDLGSAGGLELLRVIAELDPGVRRVLVTDTARPLELTLAETAGAAHATLAIGASGAAIAAALGLRDRAGQLATARRLRARHRDTDRFV